MNNLVVFYSWTGKTKVVAEELARIMGAELKEIEEVKPRKGFMGSALAALLNLKSAIKPMNLRMQDYENVFIGTPIWASRITPAINAFLGSVDLRGKNVYLFVTQGDDKLPDQLVITFCQKVSRFGGKPMDSINFRTEMKKELSPESVTETVGAWLKKNGITG